MYCSNCGNPLLDNTNSCCKCGLKIVSANVTFQNPKPKYYWKDIGFHNLSEYVRELILRTKKSETIGRVLLFPSLFGTLLIVPVIPLIAIITIPILITSVLFNVRVLKNHIDLKKLYANYISQPKN